MRRKILSKQTGITLIALVVTIVVLLILAGVSIAMLAGEDGIINKAQQARLESNHSAVEEGIKLQYNEYQLQIKLGYTSNDFLTYLRNKETGAIIDGAGVINVKNLLGNRLSTGNGRDLKDVYVIEETVETAQIASIEKVKISESTNTTTKYVLNYYEKSGDPIELTIIGENTNAENGKVEEVFPEVAGLYQTGTTTLLKSWEELKNENLITVEGTTLKAIDWNLEGDLVISSEIENLSSYYYYEEDWGDGGEARYEPNKIIPVSNINFNIENEIYLAEMEYTLKKLTAVYIPSTIKEIPVQAFYWADKLKKVVIQDNGVTSIGNYAFGYCGELTSITLPNSVTSIGSYAFMDCSQLTSIKLPNSVTSIGGYAFSGCSSLTSIEIPNSVTSIVNNAFEYCSGLTSVVIPNSVTNIGNHAFWACSGLTSIEIPNSVTSIGNNAFVYCRGLTSIEIPDSVTSIGSYAFMDCSRLTSIEIPNSVTSIGYGAFLRCSGLTSIEIPNSVTSIGNNAFGGCSGLTSITIDEGNTIYDSRNNCNAIIRTEDNTLITGCKNTIIPSSVTSIGDYAFYDCSGLTSITIPVSIEEIGEYAFSGCTMDLEVNYEGTQEQWNQIDIDYGNSAITKIEEDEGGGA